MNPRRKFIGEFIGSAAVLMGTMFRVEASDGRRVVKVGLSRKLHGRLRQEIETRKAEHGGETVHLNLSEADARDLIIQLAQALKDTRS